MQKSDTHIANKQRSKKDDCSTTAFASSYSDNNNNNDAFAWTGSSSTSNPDSALTSTAPLCRFYFLQGSCRYGEQCSYSHTLPDHVSSYEEARAQIPCPYFARGCCRYGDYCQLRHDPQDLNSGGIGSRNPKSGDDDDDGANAVCGICLDPVQQVGHKFGLLSCCQHVFCFECLMEWRKEGTEEAEDRRSCPTCRKKSDWVIPSNVMATTEEDKDRISTQYRARLGRIPCKHFDGKLGSCPYGSDCFYAHISKESGLDCKKADRTMKQLYEQRRRHRNQRRLDNDIEMISRAMLLMDLYAYRGLGYNFDFYDSDLDSDDDDEAIYGWESRGN